MNVLAQALYELFSARDGKYRYILQRLVTNLEIKMFLSLLTPAFVILSAYLSWLFKMVSLCSSGHLKLIM